MTGDSLVLDAMEQATLALYAANDGRAGCRLHVSGGVTSTWAPSRTPALNVVLGSRASGPGLPGQVADTVAHAAGRPFLWKVMPGDTARDRLAETLLLAGFAEVDPSTPVVGPIPAELEGLRAHLPVARPVRSPEDFDRWLVPFCAAFHVPEPDAHLCRQLAREVDLGPAAPVQHVVIEADGAPVACGTLVLSHPTLAAVFNLGVLPEARRAGFGSGVLGALAAAASDRGRTELGQFSTSAGLPLYERWGRALAPPVRNFFHPGAA